VSGSILSENSKINSSNDLRGQSDVKAGYDPKGLIPAASNSAADFLNDPGPPTTPIAVELIPAGGGCFHAKLTGGFILAERSPTPFAAACARLIALGASPDRVAVMTMGGVALRSATLASAAGGAIAGGHHGQG
jgi:hypothetical protein